MASLGITNTEIKTNLAMVMGLSRDETLVNFGWDTQTIADVNRIIRSGRRKFFSAHDWSFLEEDYKTVTIAPVSSSTITIVNGVVTLAAGSWHANAAGQRLAVAGSVYEINTRNSNSQLTLFDTSVNAAALTTYTLYFQKYSLPTNFGALCSPVRVENARDGQDLREIAVLPDYSIAGFLSRQTALARRPEAFCITSEVTTDESGEVTYYLEMYPLVDNEYVVTTDIRINPGDALSESGEIFHPSFSELMQEAILSAGEIIYNNNPGSHTQNFKDMLPDFIRKDKIAKGVRRLPRRTDGSTLRLPRNYELIVGTVDLTDAV